MIDEAELHESLDVALRRRADRLDPAPPEQAPVVRRARQIRRRRRLATGATAVVVAGAVLAAAVVLRPTGAGSVLDAGAPPPPAPAVYPVVDSTPEHALQLVARYDRTAADAPPAGPPGTNASVRLRDHLISVYPIDASAWSAGTSYYKLGGTAETILAVAVVRGQPFVPDRLVSYGDKPPGLPASVAIDPVGVLSLAIGPLNCPTRVELPPDATHVQGCDQGAIGRTGDGDLVVARIDHGYDDAPVDLRVLLAQVRLVDRALWDTLPDPEPGPWLPPRGSGRQLPFEGTPLPTPLPPLPPRDESAWPAVVPGDFCTAYRQWMQIQMTSLPSFGAQGWIRWAYRLAELAPPELATAFRTIADVEAAGGDASTDEPGVAALTVTVEGAKARCPG